MSVDFPFEEWWSLLTEEPLAERGPGPKTPLTPAPRPRPGEVSFLLIAIMPGGKAETEWEEVSFIDLFDRVRGYCEVCGEYCEVLYQPWNDRPPLVCRDCEEV